MKSLPHRQFWDERYLRYELQEIGARISIPQQGPSPDLYHLPGILAVSLALEIFDIRFIMIHRHLGTGDDDNYSLPVFSHVPYPGI